jgi:integrase
MKGYVARKGERWYAVIYEGLDPVTGRERRSWHPAGPERAEAEALAARLAGERNGRDDEGRSLTFGAFLTTRWLPGKRLTLRMSTWDGYRRKVERHILPTLGRIVIRRLRPADLEALQTFLRAAAGHRLFPAFWLAAATGMRRSELLGLRWTDIDLGRGTVSINRGLIAVAYELHETRCKTRNARRPINLDATTIAVLRARQGWQQIEQRAVGIADLGWVFTDMSGQPVHPHAISQAFERIAIRAGVPLIRLHDIRHTHATLLAQAGVHPKVVSERLGHANASSPSRHIST